MAKVRNSWLVVTYKCNNRCNWCYASLDPFESDTKPKNVDMPFDMAVGSLDLIKGIDAKKVILIGGEPTVYRRLPELIKYAKEIGLNVGMVSNGRRFSDQQYLDSLIDAGLDGSSFSIHGSNAEIHDTVTRRKGSFEETVQGIINYEKTGKVVSTSTTMSRENIGDLENIVHFLNGIGVEKVGFTTCTTSPGSKSNPGMISPYEASQLIQKLYLVGKKAGIEVRSVTPLPLCNFDPEIRDEMLREGILNYSCSMHHGSGMAIDPEGNLLPCVHWSDFPVGSVLNSKGKVISVEEFRELWSGEDNLPTRFRKSLWRFPSAACKQDTKYWGECIGGCPTFWTDFDPEKEIKGFG